MMEQYLAALPSLNRNEQGDVGRMPVMRRGAYVNNFRRTMETPKSTILNIYSGEMEYNVETVMVASMLKQILDLVYMEKVRENESGTYGVSTAVDLSIFPKGRTVLQTYFDTDPELKEKLSAIVNDELMAIVNDGPREVDFAKTRENMLKRYDEAIQENSYWLNAIDMVHFRGYDRHSGYKARLESITPAQIQAFTKNLISQSNHIEVIMDP